MAAVLGTPPSKYKLDRLFLKRFWRCCKVMFPGWLSTSFLLLVLLMGLSLAEQMLVYNTGLIPSRFYEVLLDRNKANFKSIVITSSLVILGTALADSAVKYDSRILYVKWRGLLDRQLHSGYFKHTAYYKMNVLEDKLDNIDQRITQDVDKFCESFRSSLIVFIISPFTIAYYTYQCYQSSGYLGPVCIYSYFILGTIINKLIITPIVGVVVKQEKLEGDFRFKHMQIRSNAESIAFYRSGDLEMRKTNSRLQSLLQTQLRLVNLQCILVFGRRLAWALAHQASENEKLLDGRKIYLSRTTVALFRALILFLETTYHLVNPPVVVNVIDYVGAILSYLIIAIALFGGKYDDLSLTELGAQISRNSFFAMYLINCGTKLIDLSNGISNMAGYVHRIGQLLERFADMETDSEEKTTENEDSLGVENLAPHTSDTIFKLTNVSYAPPNCPDPLVKDLDLEISHGKAILITGCTGSGKSSLFRILSGIWSPLSGEVLRFLPFNPKAVLFLPQKTFLTDGTLRQQLMYPCEDPSYGIDSETGGNEDEKLLELLDTVGLTTLCARVGGLDNPVDSNWEDMLSPGEMQRLSFARLFFHRPLVALLDEATSALDVASETRLYSSCKQLGITVVSVGHRKSLRELHDFILKLDGEGGWEFKKIKNE